MGDKTQVISKSEAIESTKAFMDELGVPRHLQEDVLDAYSKLFRVGTGFRSMPAASMACLLMLLELERKDAPDDPEYMRLRGIAQNFTKEFLEPQGYASQWRGEPGFYGIANGLLVKMLRVYEDQKPAEA